MNINETRQISGQGKSKRVQIGYFQDVPQKISQKWLQNCPRLLKIFCWNLFYPYKFVCPIMDLSVTPTTFHFSKQWKSFVLKHKHR